MASNNYFIKIGYVENLIEQGKSINSCQLVLCIMSK
ncbi:hypothetical protein C7460_108181 [Marinoscillum furvescens DSM 4134]|uniref:Uncharacterized protein n=1 Tax=Marinoscillum furvescens DSM 4134 TaxID=1122208 RepID=A0A3D9L342_MARFU|nr:hypothetical protein C7460_108181 [Marinoscillum furvescens DSM 4134]